MARPGRRYLTLALVLLALGAGGAAAWRWRLAHRRPPVEFETAPVDIGRVVSRVTATGTLSALVTVQVGSQVSGRIQKLFVDFNSEVKKGELIATIDPQLFAATVEQNRANMLAAVGNAAKAAAQERDAKRQFDRARGLVDRKLIAQADFDTAEANLEVAKGQTAAADGAVAQAKAGLHQAEVNLDYTKIVSPTDGVVISRSVDVGQTVAAAMQAPTLFVIAQDLRKMQVDTSVAEADIGKLQAGMPATFTVDAYSGTRFRGRIRQIRNAAQTVQNVVTYDAVIDVDNDDLRLRPGMTANVTFIWAEKDNALRVPNAALRFRPSADILKALGMPPLLGSGGARPGGGGRARAGAGAGPGSGPGESGAASSSAGGTTRGANAGARPGGGGAGAANARAGWSRASEDALDRRTVWLLRLGHPQSVAVRTGVSDGSLTEIVEGELHEGDVVVVDASLAGSGDAAGGSSAGPPGGGPPGMRRLF
jgi:HlyD family secretion protein